MADNDSASSMYGKVDGGSNPANRTIDPFECLLGLCRVIGLYYEVGKHETTGHWWATVSSHDWPADFYGGARTQTKRRKYSVCGSESKLDALFSAITMAIGSLHHNCDVWRGIVEQMPEYASWFMAERPQVGGEGDAAMTHARDKVPG